MQNTQKGLQTPSTGGFLCGCFLGILWHSETGLGQKATMFDSRQTLWSLAPRKKFQKQSLACNFKLLFPRSFLIYTF